MSVRLLLTSRSSGCLSNPLSKFLFLASLSSKINTFLAFKVLSIPHFVIVQLSLMGRRLSVYLFLGLCDFSFALVLIFGFLCSVEYTVSYVYHAMFAYFDRDNVALKGLAK